MARTVEFYIDRANLKFEAGFTTKAAQKEALSDLNHAHDLLRNEIRKVYLNIERADRTEAQEAVYWGLADLHVWKQKHSDLVTSVFPELQNVVTQIEDLAAQRLAIKAAEILPVERKEDARIAGIIKSIRELMEKRKIQFVRGLKIYDMFHGLPVSANVHEVTNQYGTRFLRCYYYLAGELTPLQVILAILDTKKREEEASQ